MKKKRTSVISCVRVFASERPNYSQPNRIYARKPSRINIFIFGLFSILAL